MTKRLRSCWPASVGCRATVLACLILWLVGPPAGAAPTSGMSELDGVAMPTERQAAGLALRLNGMGLRTYSVFHVHVYVAGLYLEQPSGDAETILRSDSAKLMMIEFVHDVTTAQARKAWATGLADNCRAPCHLPEDEIARFLAAVPEFHRGDTSTLLFVGQTVQIEVNGHVLGTVGDPAFSRTILATFIGPFPPSETFKRGLLGRRD